MERSGRAGMLALLTLLALVAGLLGAATLLGREQPVRSSASAPGPSSRPSDSSDDLEVLHSWDAARARAWERQDRDALRGLYVRGATAGERDAALLASYAERGLRVVGLRMQLLAVEPVRRGPGLLVLRVTDRLVGARVDGPDGRVALPRDEPSTRVMRFVRRDGAWLLDRVVRTPTPRG